MVTEVRKAVVENVTEVGSAFATTQEGESVFINGRIVQLLNIQPLEELRVFLVPNYENRRAQVPWRSVRVERLSGPEADYEDRPDDAVLRLMEPGGVWSVAQIAEEIDADPGAIGRAAARLFMLGKICRADVYSKPGLLRPTLIQYAINMEEFEVTID